MQDPFTSEISQRLWLVEHSDGYTMQCEIAQHARGWVVWFTVDSLRVGGHRFESLDGARQWGDRLLQDIQRVGESVASRTGRADNGAAALH